MNNINYYNYSLRTAYYYQNMLLTFTAVIYECAISYSTVYSDVILAFRNHFALKSSIKRIQDTEPLERKENPIYKIFTLSCLTEKFILSATQNFRYFSLFFFSSHYAHMLDSTKDNLHQGCYFCCQSH